MSGKGKELELQVESWPIERLKPYDRNPRTHSEAQVEQIAASIREFGFLNPIIVAGDSGVLAGHGRLAAANQLGLARVPVIQVDHLDESQRRAFVMADNKIAANGGWDLDQLQAEIEELEFVGFDLELLGFSLDELEEITVGTKPAKRVRAPRVSSPRARGAPASPALPGGAGAPPPVTTKLAPGPEPKKGKGSPAGKPDPDMLECPNCSHRFPPGKHKVR